MKRLGQCLYAPLMWDRLLGTAFDSDAHVMGSEDLGIGSQPDYPTGYLRQMMAPFQAEQHGVPPPATPPGLERSAVDAVDGEVLE